MEYFTIKQGKPAYIVLPKGYKFPDWMQKILKGTHTNGILEEDVRFFAEPVGGQFGDTYSFINTSGYGRCGGKIYQGPNTAGEIKKFLETDFFNI